MTFLFQVGDKLPSVDLFEDSPANKINTGDLASGKKVIIFGVPGAFTPGCSKVIIFKYLHMLNLSTYNKILQFFADPFTWLCLVGRQSKISAESG